MTKEEKKQAGVSLFRRQDVYVETDPIEEMFALNLGDFVSENLISSDLAKKIQVNSDKKERIRNQLKELISIYSSKNTLSVLKLTSLDEKVIYTSVAKSIVQMLEVKLCNLYLVRDGEIVFVGGSCKDFVIGNVSVKDLVHNDILEKDSSIYISMRGGAMPVGMIEISSDTKPKDVYMELVLSIASLFGTTISLQSEIDFANTLMNSNATEFELKQSRAELTALIGDLCDNQQYFVESLAKAVDSKGHYTVSHSRNSANLARNISKKLGLNEKTTDLVYYAALLQNIGKIILPEKIFANNGKLSKEELQKIKNHTSVGVNLLMNINFLAEVVPYIIYQTERFDGSGTPEGLKGQSIPFGSRIIAVSDAYCAMVSDRPFRKAMSTEQAIDIIKSEAGKKWDSDVVNALIQIVK